MKRIICSVVIALIMTGFVIFTEIATENISKNISASLERSCEYAVLGDMFSAKTHFESAYSGLYKYKDYLFTICVHSHIDDIFAGFERCRSFILSEDRTSFLAETFSLIYLVDNVCGAEQISIANIM